MVGARLFAGARLARVVRIAALLALIVPAAAAGTIKGRVRLPRGARERTDVGEAVVYLVAIPDKVERRLSRHALVEARMGQKGGGFLPPVLAIPSRTTVRFVNQGRSYHNVFSVTPGARFDLGRYAPRESRTHAFEGQGPVQVFCELHPTETGWVFVAPNHAFVRPDARGAFHIPKLPAGPYTVGVWHPRLGVKTFPVEMPPRGDLTLTLRL